MRNGTAALHSKRNSCSAQQTTDIFLKLFCLHFFNLNYDKTSKRQQFIVLFLTTRFVFNDHREAEHKDKIMYMI
jgi:hypothetical protein